MSVLSPLRFLCFFFAPTIRAAVSPCSDELTATNCFNEQNDEICQEAFPNTEAFPTINSRCTDPEWPIAEECRKQCRSCCQHPDFMCSDRNRWHAGCLDDNSLLCPMLQKLCEQSQYMKLMAAKCKRSCNLCTVDTRYPGWIFNPETHAYYKFLNTLLRNESNSAVKYERLCAEEGAHLVSIHSEIENAFVHGLASCERIFIGLRGQTADRFEWLDGSRVDFKNFYPGYPLGSQYCAYISGNNMYWYTTSCLSKGCAVCKKIT